MSKEDDNFIEAKKCLKAHIKFLESLLKHLNGTDEILKGRAMWVSWCLNGYITYGLIKDIERAMLAHKASNDPID